MDCTWNIAPGQRLWLGEQVVNPMDLVHGEFACTHYQLCNGILNKKTLTGIGQSKTCKDSTSFTRQKITYVLYEITNISTLKRLYNTIYYFNVA